MPVDEFAFAFDVTVREGDYGTVGGMLVTKLGKIPAKGEVVQCDGFSLKVIEKDRHKIKTLLAHRQAGGKKN